MMRRLWITVVCALFTACGAGDGDDGDEARVDGVVRGARDRGRHPAVVAILSTDGMLCTGALVAPRRVLTARHCVSVTPEEVDCAARRQVFGERAASSLAVVAGDDALAGEVSARVERVVVPATERLCGADVAVLVLDRALRGATPRAVAARAAPREGDAVTVVADGRRGDSSRAGVGVRYARDGVRVVSVSDDEIATSEGTCAGDSGSPALDARTGRVVAVLSRGGARCVGALAVWTRASVAQALLDAAR